MEKEHYYDPALRDLEKQHARERDDADLASGRVSASELQRRNSFFNGFDVKGAIIQNWKEFE